MKYRNLFFILAAFSCVVLTRASLAADVQVWQVDVCEKVFPDATPSDAPTIAMSAAANEYESAQIGFFSSEDVAIELSASNLTGEKTNAVVPSDAVRIRAVGTIPIVHNTPLADSIITRKAPCDMPDVLYDRATLALKANEAQAAWITILVPKGTAADVYSGSIAVKGNEIEKTLAVKLEVFPFELSDKRNLYMTNWWSPGNIAVQHKVDMWSDGYWRALENYIKNMGEHRQNALWVAWRPEPGGFVQATRDENGAWSFDFSRLERILDLGAKYGVTERIELGHIGGIDRQNHVVSFSSATIYDKSQDKNITLSIDEWLEPCLKATCDMLRKRGEFDRAMLHIADEPYIPDVDSWREASDRARKVEPDLKQIDAIESVNFSGKLDVWVPKLSHFDRWRKAFDARRDQGEFWYYICCHPYGSTYPNRFMDLPGVRVRELHWLNYTEDLVGYLHWGYNYWQGEPFGPPSQKWGPGDSHCVYPGEDGPLDTIRWEIQRESVEDFEYLKYLENAVAKIKSEVDPEKGWFIDPKARSLEIARRVVPDLKRTTLDYNVLNAARRAIVDEIVAATGPVRLVVQTYPEDGAVAVLGPVLHELYGLTSPGATVTVMGEEVPVSDDGFFKKQLDLPAGETTVEVVATLDGRSVKTTRRFVVE